MNRGAQTKLGLTWTQNQSCSGMLMSVDPASPLSSRSQLCQHQPLPHQISSQAEIPKTSAGCENSPGFEWSTPKQRARLGSGKQGKLVTQANRSWGVTPLETRCQKQETWNQNTHKGLCQVSVLKTFWVSTRRFFPFGSIYDHFSTDKGILCCQHPGWYGASTLPGSSI